MRVALDTNILAYAEGVNGDDRKQRTLQALAYHADDELVVPVQALGELFTVLTRKARWPAAQARAAILTWRDACVLADTTEAVLLEAADLVPLHQFALWDAIMIAAAAQTGCRLLLSGDMHTGFLWRGVEIRNPLI
jgi:predicted nucleic acid-binding protein